METQGVGVLGAVLEGRYRVDRLLARGGMSSVYAGLDQRLDRPVAIKVMEAKFAGDRSFIDRFELEARAAARLHHPNVVAVHDQGVDGDRVYLVMELVSGGTLRDLLRERGALPVPLALSVLEPVLSALASAHRADLVHRDVKPENVLIGQGGTVKVADFGLVRAVATAGMTSDSVILGTVAYLSPEQVTTGVADPRSDVYAAGVMLYETLTGAPPYQGDTAMSVAYRHVNDDVPPPSEAVRDIPAALDDLVLRATRRDANLRPANAAAFLDELVRLRATLGVHRVPVPVPTQAPPTDAGPNQSRGRHRADDLAATDNDDGDESAAAARSPNGTGGATPAGDRGTGAHARPDADDDTQIVAASVIAGHDSATMRSDAAAMHTVRTPLVRAATPIGPQGTRAMSRADLMTPMPPPPPAPPDTGRRGAGGAAGGGGYGAQRQRSRRTFLIWISVVLVLAAVIGVVAWWFGSGRWTSVPSVSGLDPTTAERTLAASDLSATLIQAHDNRIPAGQVASTSPAIGARALRGSTVTVVVSEGRPIVPDVTPGASPDAVKQAIVAAQLTPVLDATQNAYDDTVPVNMVVAVKPGPGTQLNINARVVIVLSKGKAPKPVPDVTGQPHDGAFAALRDAGFQPYDAPKEFNQQVAGGSVVRTDPPAGKVIDPNADHRVAVVVSSAVSVPNLTGQSVGDAVGALQQLGLTPQVQSITGDQEGQVFQQAPGAGTVVQPGTTVTLVVFP